MSQVLTAEAVALAVAAVAVAIFHGQMLLAVGFALLGSHVVYSATAVSRPQARHNRVVEELWASPLAAQTELTEEIRAWDALLAQGDQLQEANQELSYLRREVIDLNINLKAAGNISPLTDVEQKEVLRIIQEGFAEIERKDPKTNGKPNSAGDLADLQRTIQTLEGEVRELRAQLRQAKLEMNAQDVQNGHAGPHEGDSVNTADKKGKDVLDGLADELLAETGSDPSAPSHPSTSSEREENVG